jgi:hypothetical protein
MMVIIGCIHTILASPLLLHVAAISMYGESWLVSAVPLGNHFHLIEYRSVK